ncbi:MAG: tripartite tricarboxylate transporter substrate binding protein [Proteobacteria bacterium]|nr:tripartite tricarboxylate transporter substrate binding protein [Burkholderiales bacterium]
MTSRRTGAAAHLPIVTIAIVASGLLAGSKAGAQTYPAKPIRLVVPLAAGGGVDLISRLVGQKMSENLRQPVLVDNRPGASTMIGTEIVARSPADGYTLVMASSSHGINTSLYKVPFDPVKDFAGISLLATSPLLLVVHPSVPAKSLADLITLARKNPGKVNYGSSGNASVLHLSGEMFNVLAGVRTVHIPYKGSGPAIPAVLAGEIDMLFSTPVSTMPLVRNGRLRALATTGLNRSRVTPELPTVAEAGLAGFETGAWYALLAPAGTPPAVIERLNAEAVKAVQLPDVTSRLDGEGIEIVGSTPEQAMQYIQAQLARWAKVIKAAGIKAE